MNCRHCQHPLSNVFLDLGFAPPSNAYIAPADAKKTETYFPLKLFVCDQCWLVQTEDYAQADELFNADYAYFSSVSQSWLVHAEKYVDKVTQQFALGPDSHVVEVASNDGYLLKNFVAKKIPCLGIEPTASTAAAAEQLGIPVLREFFGLELAKRLVAQSRGADLVLGNNVFAHVPDINDFTAGLCEVLNPEGVVTLEFPHLLRLLEENQFDTVYHEHFSYLSLYAVSRIFESQGLRIWDVELLNTHGGSLRVYGCRKDASHVETDAVRKVLDEECSRGMQQLSTYTSFQQRADRVKDDLLQYLIEQKKAGKKVAAYGAAAKGNTLLNYAGIKPDLLPYVCDAAPSKQNKYLPGSHIPVLPPEVLRERKPDVILILPWNIADEVVSLHGYVREWGGEFVAAVPEMRIFK
ncbi:SAM-dependent methyltransferase [Herbaspirillum sp. meg3]|uniref:class I SAM-dependent methyltransferase n=1 Tax=Herbaspirillum sp. meg3 TaxID=2025949 RepID=UPI000B98D83E|nr:class I SAM-dependent methyltransferase [Herbaspirillum sp. meg3]ASU40576.1 SAM-dependent methyltransferase [Herbaspirillum sp. meg3]